jgi:2-oxoglutarate dehydrogenase E2 component (dihydrolipoamide succinyltransferase)
MARYQLLLPKMGESVAEATIIKWLKKPGDYIEADEAVMEIATDKVDSEVPSPVSGKLVEQLCKEDEVMQVGAVIAVIETAPAQQSGYTSAPVENRPPVMASQQPAPQSVAVKPEPEVNIPGIDQLKNRIAAPNAEEFKGSARFYSPLVKHIATQENISVAELDQIPGTGSEGRLTKDDLLNYIQTKPNGQPSSQSYAPSSPSPQSTEQRYSQPAAKQSTEAQKPTTDPSKTRIASSMSGVDEVIEMDRMRRLIADHMVMSKHTSPHVTSFVEADVTALVMWRDKVKSSFEKREGEKITFTPIFIEAVVKAIKDMPMVNVTVNGTQIIKKGAINISMATALPNGNLIVPVIKKADELNLLGLTKAVNDLANRARTGKLQPDDVKEGTFTITNVGTFGNVMGTPIINQPQVAILAVGAIKKKPAVIETTEGDVIAIRHMMFLSLSYDHRVVDGSLGGSFVRRVADYLEKWDPLRTI